jgi:pimeloyl-ACP methyl ester carboxylesterase
MQEQARLVKGVRIRWEETLGPGPRLTPVVLVHGIPTSLALFRHVVPLVTGARCLALEMVG